MKKIAVIGAGISGLGAAYLLQQKYDVTLFEKESRLGGHARTVNVDYMGEQIAVDTGFIVFNYRNYPHLTAMFKHLDVPVKPSDMSLGLSLGGGAFEWGCQGLKAVFAQKSNLVSWRFWRMIADILRFNKCVHQFRNSDLSLGEVLAQLKMGDDFKNRFLLPTAGAIWSSAPEQILDFPASSFINFFDNHGLLTVNNQPKWWTVDGGSVEYVKRIAANFGGKLELNANISSVRRIDGGVEVVNCGEAQIFDEVVFATHSDQALLLLADGSEAERAVLGNIAYQKNYAYLHRDEKLMPKRKAAWASWNYLCDGVVDENARITVTYYMNRLQSIAAVKPLFVTLNPSRPPHDDLIFDQTVFEHPVYDANTLEAQRDMPTIQGVNKAWFCGAYLRYGFHEDGLNSAVEVAKMLGVEVPW
jgi:predicted NAD/FAD-binding protein